MLACQHVVYDVIAMHVTLSALYVHNIILFLLVLLYVCSLISMYSCESNCAVMLFHFLFYLGFFFFFHMNILKPEFLFFIFLRYFVSSNLKSV